MTVIPIVVGILGTINKRLDKKLGHWKSDYRSD